MGDEVPDAELDRIRADVAARLPRETYEAHRESLVYQFKGLRRDIETLQKEFDDYVKDQKEKAKEAEKARQGVRQWTIAAIVIPLLAVAANVVLFLAK